MLSEIQKQKFKEISGFDYKENHGLEGRFQTSYPNNDRNWEYSPWSFTYKFDTDTNYLHMQLDHRMTNNRISVFDQEGNEAKSDIHKFFQPHW